MTFTKWEGRDKIFITFSCGWAITEMMLTEAQCLYVTCTHWSWPEISKSELHSEDNIFSSKQQQIFFEQFSCCLCSEFMTAALDVGVRNRLAVFSSCVVYMQQLSNRGQSFRFNLSSFDWFCPKQKKFNFSNFFIFLNFLHPVCYTERKCSLPVYCVCWVAFSPINLICFWERPRHHRRQPHSVCWDCHGRIWLSCHSAFWLGNSLHCGSWNMSILLIFFFSFLKGNAKYFPSFLLFALYF